MFFSSKKTERWSTYRPKTKYFMTHRSWRKNSHMSKRRSHHTSHKKLYNVGIRGKLQLLIDQVDWWTAGANRISATTPCCCSMALSAPTCHELHTQPQSMSSARLRNVIVFLFYFLLTRCGFRLLPPPSFFKIDAIPLQTAAAPKTGKLRSADQCASCSASSFPSNKLFHIVCSMQ